MSGDLRWTARATSVAEIERELARIWGSAARATIATPAEATPEAETAPEAGATAMPAAVPGGDVAAARGDPHLAGWLDEPGDISVRMRTSVLTLVVLAERPETTERVADTIEALMGRHPSRAIIVAPGDPDGPARLEASIDARCMRSAQGSATICTERILVRAGGELDAHLAELVEPLRIHDLPLVLWWADDPPVGRDRFAAMLRTCDRLLVDTGAFRGDGSAHLAGLAPLCAAASPVIHDIGWMRLSLWRELLAELFDHPVLAPELAGAKALRLDVLTSGGEARLAKPALYAGWLASVLGWQVVAPMAPRRGTDALVATCRSPRGEVTVEIRPVEQGPDVAGRRSGSLARVELELGTRGRPIRARVTRHPDHLLATADWAGAEVARRAGRREPFDEASYVAEALERTGQDRMLTRAVTAAVALIGPGDRGG